MIFRFLLTGLALLLALLVHDSPASELEAFIEFVDDRELPADELESFLKERPVADYRVVRIDTSALRQMLRDAFPPTNNSNAPRIALALVDGTLVEVHLQGGGENHSGWQTGFASFRGRITGDENSTVQCLISPDGSADLVIRTSGQRYKLEKTAKLPYHVYWSWDPDFNRQVD